MLTSGMHTLYAARQREKNTIRRRETQWQVNFGLKVSDKDTASAVSAVIILCGVNGDSAADASVCVCMRVLMCAGACNPSLCDTVCVHLSHCVPHGVRVKSGQLQRRRGGESKHVETANHEDTEAGRHCLMRSDHHRKQTIAC